MAEEESQQRDENASDNPQKSEVTETRSPEQTTESSKVNEELTENMEVHHHPQLEHKHKPWKEYLLEGLMIFIAVMMGFIAENIREGISNREHVRELTAQLVQDLKADTIQLNKMYQTEWAIRAANDTLINLLQQPWKKENSAQLVNLVVKSHSMWPFHPSGGAVAAIKNELHLKQFSSSKIIGHISEYEAHISLLHTVQDITLQYQRSLIDPFLLHHVTSANLDEAFNKGGLLSNPEMRNLSQEDLSQLGTDMILVRINTNELLVDNRQVKEDAVKLLQYVREQFDADE